MAYTAWSVVFGEQPTAAKWNQLGTNDAGFKDMSNMDDDSVLARHLAAGLDTPILDTDTITKHSVDKQAINVGAYHTLINLAGAYELKGGVCFGINAGIRLTVDGVVVINDTASAQATTNTQTEDFGVAIFPPARSAATLKVEIHNASGGSRTFGARAYTKAL